VLSDRMGISLRALAPRLHLSVASLFGYRSGKIPISAKAWSKLERVESEVLKQGDPARFAGNDGNPKDIPVPKWDDPSTLRDEPWDKIAICAEMGDVDSRIHLMERALAGLEAQAAMIRHDLNRLKTELKP